MRLGLTRGRLGAILAAGLVLALAGLWGWAEYRRTEVKAMGVERHESGSEELRARLTPEQYNVCFLKGTEPPGSGKYYHFAEPGQYHCVACGALLFPSETKYDSGSGWPAFWDTYPQAVTLSEDLSLGMVRTEVQCAKCGAHLGHVFDDGPVPTGRRYCINSLALEFTPAE